jgi:hypothetical protein
MSYSWRLLRETRSAAALSLLLVSGRSGLKDARPTAAPVSTPDAESPAISVPEPASTDTPEPFATQGAPSQVQPVIPPEPAAATQPAAPKAASSAATATHVAAPKSQPSAPNAPASSPPLAPTTVAKADPMPAPTTVAKAAPTPAPAAAPKAAQAPVASRPTTPPLDLKSLETRLRETKAVGVFTKLSLKNQVDDLLGQAREYHKSQKPTLAALRQSYNLLMLKVLALLQDSDPTLARDIVASREAIWGILADPKKFTESNLMAGVLP